MYSYIKGSVTEKNLDSENFVVEISGIGYLINTNLKFINHFTLGDDAKVYVSHQLKEDSEKLFGFSDRASRDLFDTLISVSGIGPKAALSILNVLELSEIVSAVIKDKPKVIACAQGVGLKTAQKAIIELKNKLQKFSASSSAKEIKAKSENSSDESSGYSSLTEVNIMLGNLGYSEIEVDRIISKAKESNVEDDIEALMHYSLKNLPNLVNN